MDDCLETLSRDPWPEPAPGATSLEQRVAGARRVPLRDLTTADLRILLGQQVDLPIVIGRGAGIGDSVGSGRGRGVGGDCVLVLDGGQSAE